jgi:sirohydrochlorin cobaltochelatase
MVRVMIPALVLFAHGARDPEWAHPLERLREQLRLLLPQTPVELAFLEFMDPDLPAAVEQLIDQGAGAITVVPVFLAQGAHVKHGLPALVESLRSAYPEHSIDVTAPIGEQPEVIAAIASCIARLAGR